MGSGKEKECFSLIKINTHTFLKQNKQPTVSRRKEIIQIRAETNEMKKKKQKRSMKVRDGSLKDKIDKLSARLAEKERERVQVNKNQK